jgi:hypothetical protein
MQNPLSNFYSPINTLPPMPERNDIAWLRLSCLIRPTTSYESALNWILDDGISRADVPILME